jgi:hypothetical protein
MKKNPLVAAVLNFFLFGGGYLYLGKHTRLAWLLTLGGTAAQVVEIKVSPLVDNAIPALWPFLIGGLVVMKIGLAMDAYQEAQEAGQAA